MEAPEQDNLPPLAHHGALDYEELERLGLNPNELIDFSVNSNPYGPSPNVLRALQSVSIDRYPDREVIALRRALSQQLGIPNASFVVGNGTAELIWLIAFCFLGRGKRALILGPTFGEYDRSARLMQAAVEWIRARPEESFRPPVQALEKQMQDMHPEVVFICNPNNPTGQWIDVERIASWARRHSTTLFVIDEAYLQFMPGSKSAISLQLPNILVLRSMTKDYALAGLRLGYAVGNEGIITTISHARIPWSVNSFAQAAGLAALEDEAYYRDTLKSLSDTRDQFLQSLSSIGLKTETSRTHYFLMKVGKAVEFRTRMLEHQILVRDCSSFGLPNYVRISTRTPSQNKAFCDSLIQANSISD